MRSSHLQQSCSYIYHDLSPLGSGADVSKAGLLVTTEEHTCNHSYRRTTARFMIWHNGFILMQEQNLSCSSKSRCALVICYSVPVTSTIFGPVRRLFVFIKEKFKLKSLSVLFHYSLPLCYSFCEDVLFFFYFIKPGKPH